MEDNDPSLWLWEHVHDLVVVTDGGGAVLWRSPAARHLNRPSFLDHVRPEQRGALQEVCDVVSAQPGNVFRLACDLSGGPGGWRPVELVLTSHLATSEDRSQLAWTVRPNSPHADLDRADLLHRATHDSLTSLPNRAYLLERLDEALRETSSGRKHCAVLYVDLDGLKPVNDRHGHAAGDKVLVTVAGRVRQTVRPEDTVARIGGDEFVIVAGSLTHEHSAVDIAERVRAAVGRPVAIGALVVSVTASIGVALGRNETASVLLHAADTALYRAKEAGRNLVVLSEPTTEDRRSPRPEAVTGDPP